MAKSDFSGVGKQQIRAGMNQATSKYGQQPKATPEEAAQRAEEMRTRGRAGCHMPRICVSLTPSNRDFVQVMARAQGLTQQAFINMMIAEYKTNHGDFYERAKAMTEQLNAETQAIRDMYLKEN